MLNHFALAERALPNLYCIDLAIAESLPHDVLSPPAGLLAARSAPLNPVPANHWRAQKQIQNRWISGARANATYPPLSRTHKRAKTRQNRRKLAEIRKNPRKPRAAKTALPAFPQEITPKFFSLLPAHSSVRTNLILWCASRAHASTPPKGLTQHTLRLSCPSLPRSKETHG